MKTDVIALFHELLSLFSAPASTREFYSAVIRKVCDLLDVEDCTFTILDREQEQQVLHYLEDNELKTVIRTVPGGAANWSIQNNQTVIINNPEKDDRTSAGCTINPGVPIRNLACVPIQNLKGDALGALEVCNKQHGEFSEQDEETFEILGLVVSAALENAKNYIEAIKKNIEFVKTRKRLLQQMEQMDDVLEIESFANQSPGISDLYRFILQKCLKMVGAQGITLALRDDDGKSISCYATSTSRPDDLKTFKIEPTFGMIGYTLKFNKIRKASNPPPDHQKYSKFATMIDFPLGSILCVPVPSVNGCIGVMELLKSSLVSAAISKDHEVLLRLIAGQISRIIQVNKEREKKRKSENLATIGQMLSGIVHDFKTPMAILSGLFYLTVTEEREEERKNSYDQALKQIKLLQSMVEDTLAFARGESKVLMRNVRMSQFIMEMKNYLHKSYQQHKDIKLNIHSSYNGEARFDENKLKRVIYNIVRNGIEAATETGIGTIDLDVTQENGSLVFSVADNGPGIPDHIRGKIFDSFATFGKKNGTGLGLAIAKEIVEQHNGKIDFTTEIGKGTTFFIRLPLEME